VALVKVGAEAVRAAGADRELNCPPPANIPEAAATIAAKQARRKAFLTFPLKEPFSPLRNGAF